MERYEPLEHTADTGIVAYGDRLERLFENAAFGLFDLMYGISSHGGEARRHHAVEVEAESLPELLVNWLEELLFLSETEEEALVSFSLEMDEGRVRASVGGVPFGEVSLVGPPVKAVTYHDLEVAPTDRGWRARVIFDV